MNPVATYSFLPWLRQGVANTITAQDLDPSVKTRATTHVELTLSGDPVAGGAELTATVGQDIALYGPGDIIGIDPRAVIRTDPGKLDHQRRGQLPARGRLLRRRLPLALHPGRPRRHRPAAAALDHSHRPGRKRVHRGPERRLAAVAVHHRAGHVGLPAGRRTVGMGARPCQRHPVRRPQPARRAGHDRGSCPGCRPSWRPTATRRTPGCCARGC